MEASRTRKRWTYSEFARLPESASTRYEIIDDQLVVTPAPSLHHQRIAGRLFAKLFGFVEEHELGEVVPAPVDVLFAEGDYMEPDIVFVRKGRADLLSDRGVEGPPDLLVEILSPSTELRDRGIKCHGAREPAGSPRGRTHFPVRSVRDATSGSSCSYGAGGLDALPQRAGRPSEALRTG